MILEGRAIVFNQPTVIYEYEGIEFKEIINGKALDTTPLNDVLLRYNHSDSITPLARTRGGSLQINVKPDGLYFRASLFNTTSAKDVYELIQVGALDKMSFGFTVNKDAYDPKTHTRTILAIDRLFEISVVDQPAYEQTSVQARGGNIIEQELVSFFEQESQRMRAEAKQEILRKFF